MKETERRTIDGKIYEVTQFGAKMADRTLVRLLRIIGPGVSAVKADAGLESIILSGLSGLTRDVREEDIEWLRDQMVACTKQIRTGEKGVEVPIPLEQIYDTEFRGKTSTRMQVLIFALQVNFADFLGESGLGNIAKQVAARVQSGLTSPPNVTGSSGDSQPAPT